MMVFERGGKINFVDENNVVVGYDTEQSCCEKAGYYITPNIIYSTDMKAYIPNLANYRFDTTFFQEKKMDEPMIEENYAVFKLYSIDKKPDLYLILYNAHNGYYSHGFECKVNGTIIHSGSL